MTKYTVGGFTFEDEESAKAAAKELKAVEYIIAQVKDSDDDQILKLYNKLITQKMFSTPVGLAFIDQLKQNLVSSGKLKIETNVSKKTVEIKDDGISEKKSVEKKNTSKTEIRKDVNKAKPQTKAGKKLLSESEQLIKLRRVNLILTILSITLGLCVVGMFYVSTTINSPSILNYEEKLIDKYSEWEQELSEREDAIREKERSFE